jgi:hypothetical protein
MAHDMSITLSLVLDKTFCCEQVHQCGKMPASSQVLLVGTSFKRFSPLSVGIITTNAKKFCYCKKQRWHNIFVSIIDKIIASALEKVIMFGILLF